MSGWILLHRAIWSSSDFKPEPFSEREAFIWSVSQAAHTAHPFWFNGQQVDVARGEFVTSSRKLASTFRWSEKRARSFMGRMQKRGNWTLRTPHQSPHLATVISICNYERFQSAGRRTGAPMDAANDAAGTHLGRTSDAQQEEGLNNGNEGERKELVAAPPARAPSLPYETAVSAWSQIAAIKSWSPVHPTLPLNTKRKEQLGAVLKTHGLDGWVAGLQRAADSAMLGGPDPPAWFNFTFAINPNNFVKIIEGNYDRAFPQSASAKSSGNGSAWLDARAGLLGASGAS